MNYFPTYLAAKEAFCNRQEELKRIAHDIEQGSPILLISPRRYGKTSVTLRALEKSALPYVHIDLYKAFSEADAVRFILNGVGNLLGQLETAPKKLLVLAGDFFARLNIQVSYHGAGLSLSFKDKNERNNFDVLLDTLKQLNELAKAKHKKVIVFLDEFQVVSEISQHHAVESILREVAQSATHVMFIFSGSNRHLMAQMFHDRKRPFYKLCDHIVLERISAHAYENHITKAFKVKWNTTVSVEVIHEILALTERHPYYVNKLCSMLWQQTQLPTQSNVKETWLALLLENKSITERELSLLTLVQRRLLLFIAIHGSMQNIFSQEVMADMRLSIGGIQNALKKLLQLDYVYKDQDGYHIVDPLLKATLALGSST
jgi:hypothetical protein